LPEIRRRYVANELRNEKRKFALKTGQVFFGEQQDCCDCLVWDMAQSGAMIEADLGEANPEKLRLISEALYLDQLCEIVWREGRKIGLKFVA
jgi:hypothetical protein